MPKAKRKILVVEDSPVEQTLLQKILRNNGYEVYAAWSGEECFRLASAKKPDAILMDIIFPVGDGKEMAKQLLENEETKDIPILFMSNTIDAREDKGSEIFEISGRVFRAFAKPLHQQRILSAIRKEINRRESGGELPKPIKDKLK